jgi:hypothetical protein
MMRELDAQTVPAMMELCELLLGDDLAVQVAYIQSGRFFLVDISDEDHLNVLFGMPALPRG